MQRLAAGLGARSALAAEALPVLGRAVAGRPPAGFAAWRDLAERLYGPVVSAPPGSLKEVAAKVGLAGDRLPFDRALFALQSYYALAVRRVAAELCGEAAAGALDEPVFGWVRGGESPEVEAVVERISAAAAECAKLEFTLQRANQAGAESGMLTREREHAGRIVATSSFPPPLPAVDLFKHLYESLFPRALRHALGEYYTPDWLADHVLEQAGWPGSEGRRLLDPSCGSGTFLVAAIGELRRGEDSAVAREARLERIAARVAGFDLNPLAVLSARANYLVAVRDLLPADRPVSVPVFCCDAIGGDVRAPGGPFDVLAGNPPWIAWDNLPASYRRATLPLWRHYGLFSLDGSAGRHGGAKKDLAMLLLYAAADRYLREGGRAAVVVSRTLLHTHEAGDGFRRFRLGPEGSPLGVLRVDDFSRLRVFPEAASCTAALLLEKGHTTAYPVPYVRWLPDGTRGRRGGRHSPRVEHAAEPIDASRPGSPWFVRPRGLRTPLRELVGPSDYTARLGANSAGANGVYWVELLGPAPGGVRIRNLAGAGRRTVETVECVVEPDLLFPLLRWGDVARYRARPLAHLLLPQDSAVRTGLPPDLMRARCPQTLDYFARFEPMLRRRAAYRRYQEDRPYYSMYNVGPYTLAETKVVWRRMDTRLTAAVVEQVEHPLLGARPVVPQETCVLIDCTTPEEGYYLCSLINSAVVGFLVGAHSVAGGKGFGTPGILGFLRLRRFDPDCDLHRALAAAGRAAHEAAANDGEPAGSAEQADLQQAIDAAAAALWGLDAAEQRAVARFMADATCHEP